MNAQNAPQDKFASLSPGLRAQIHFGDRPFSASPSSPVSNYLVHTKRHCNGGRTVEAGLWLKSHCDKGGKIFLTMSGAGSSFQMGISICPLIQEGKIAAIAVTGANLEESLYRLVANSHYAKIPRYEELTPQEEKELDHAGLRRITDTFLPEEESVRHLLPEIEKLWREAQAERKSYLWHEYFFQMLERGVLRYDGKPEECWLYQCCMHHVPVFVAGPEDSTMGNIFSHACYDGDHPFLKEYKLSEPIDAAVVKPAWAYQHALDEWYMNSTREMGHAFLQLGGGIAADFPICVVPHLKKDFLHDKPIEVQEAQIRPWAGFVEIHSSPMSFGSYSGAGGKEKITWSKLEPDAFMVQICGDYTEHFPDIAALILGL